MVSLTKQLDRSQRVIARNRGERCLEMEEPMFQLVPGLEETLHEFRERYPELSAESFTRILGLATPNSVSERMPDRSCSQERLKP